MFPVPYGDVRHFLIRCQNILAPGKCKVFYYMLFIEIFLILIENILLCYARNGILGAYTYIFVFVFRERRGGYSFVFV